MKIVFLSNKMTPHQEALSTALHAQVGKDFTFIESDVTDKDLPIGWQSQFGADFILRYHAGEQTVEAYYAAVRKLVDEADVLITGSAPESLLKKRKKDGKLIFRYTERPLKEGKEPARYLPRFIRWHRRNPGGKPIYLLCAGAYTASDYAGFGLFKDRAYKWGYFPATKRYESAETLTAGKNPQKILWCGRMIDWKHPDDALEVAGRLKANGYDFDMDLIGTGDMTEALVQKVAAAGLTDCVHLPGAMKPAEVRVEMERAGIYLFTSDRREGWGAVLNESMNSGCAVVACRDIGAAPFLVRDGENGFLYPAGDMDGLYEKVVYLLEHPAEQARLGKAAYRTVTEEWNAEEAAVRVVRLAQAILDGDRHPDLYADGPCSRA